MMAKVIEDVRICCCQHPSGSVFVQALCPTTLPLPDHFRVLAQKVIRVVFEVDIPHNPDRAYPDGVVDTTTARAEWGTRKKEGR